MIEEDILNGQVVQREGIIKGRDDAGGHYKWKGWCRRRIL